MKTLFAVISIGFTLIAQAQTSKDNPRLRDALERFPEADGNSCNLVGCEGVGHSFFNKDKYYELTIAETDKFLTGLGWLEKKAVQP